ncbi:Hypothetical protein CINCED_3A022109 [Cinara cedri]|uniref:Uncharacterized protein n=2 Tax=Cinara cedri TaxID=506608 RepID=A0A5E4N955_9HEMI|nr:Hypothetical protein CINCED_3A022109 [Cinara cedri]
MSLISHEMFKTTDEFKTFKEWCTTAFGSDDEINRCQDNIKYLGFSLVKRSGLSSFVWLYLNYVERELFINARLRFIYSIKNPETFEDIDKQLKVLNQMFNDLDVYAKPYMKYLLECAEKYLENRYGLEKSLNYYCVVRIEGKRLYTRPVEA